MDSTVPAYGPHRRFRKREEVLDDILTLPFHQLEALALLCEELDALDSLDDLAYRAWAEGYVRDERLH